MTHPLNKVNPEELSGENSPFPAWKVNPINFDLVEDSQVIWRYTTIPQFLNSLRKPDSDSYSALNFTRTSWFDEEDDFEGTVPRKIIENDRENLKKLSNSELDVDDHLMGKYGDQLPNVEDSDQEGSMERMRDLVYLSCWIAKERESNPMWHAYTDRKTGIAIKTTVGDLVDSVVDWPGRLFYGKIRYIDFEETKIPLSPIQYFFLKRAEFIEEQEFRLALSFKNTPAMIFPNNAEDMNSPLDKDRLDAKVDVDSLVSNIFIHPQSPKYVKPMLEEVLAKYNIEPNLVSHSSLRPSF